MSALSVGYARLVYSGAMQSSEQWACSVALVTGSILDATAIQATAAGAAAGVVTTSGIGKLIQQKSSATLDKVTAYSYGSDPRHALYVGSSPVSGIAGVGGIPHPNQVCCVVTLLTGGAGKSRRGRVYLPLNALAMSGAKISSSDVSYVLTEARAWINALNSGLGGTPVGVASITKSWIFPVTNVQVGDVMDTQRRRRNKIVEARSTASIP